MIIKKDQRLFKRVSVSLIVLALLFQAVASSSAIMVDQLSNGKTEDTVDFPAAGTSSTLGISLPFDAVATGATLSIATGPHTAGQKDYPLGPELDVSGDGDTEWAFEGIGYGAMGHQNLLSDGSDEMGASFFKEESNTSSSIRLPKGATVLSASLDINGSAGYEPWTEKEITRLVMAEEIGHSAAGLGDINGDGFDDVGVIGRGKFLIYFGEPGNFSDTPDKVLNIGFGISRIWRIGDVNADGKADILLGTGVHFGGDTVNLTADVALTGYDKGNNFGCSASYAGDINGDGVDDIIVGEAGDGMGYKGAAYIYYGGQNMDGTPDKIYDNPTGLNGQGFGDSVTFAGDLNNDTFDDLAISAMWGGPSNEGMVHIYLGGAVWDNTSDLTLLGDTDGGSWPKFGNWISGGGDLNVDGFDDLVVGAFENDGGGANTGKVYVFYGGNPMNTDEDLEMFGSSAYSYLGRQVILSPDLNGDGICDVIASAPGSGFSLPQDVLVYYGGNAMDNVSDWNKSGKDPNNYSFGWAVAPTYDMLGLGTSSIVIGAPQQWNMRYGKIFFFNLFNMTAPEHQLRLGDEMVWNATGLFNDQIMTPDITAEVNTALAGTSAVADPFGNQMATLVLNLTASKGQLNITNISLEYTFTAKVQDFVDEVNDYLSGKVGPGNITVPLNITVSSAGKVTVRDINVTITPNNPPVAVIDSLVPNPVRVTKNVTFYGNGTDSDGTVVAYRWTSDRSGLLSLVHYPTLNNLSVGKHNISLTVMDDKGRWSTPVYKELVVLKPNNFPQVTILKPTNGKEVGGILNITGTALDPDPDPLSVWVGIAQGPFLKAEGNTTWHYLWDTKTVSDGEVTIHVRAWDSYDHSSIATVTVKVNNTQVGDNLVDFELTAPQGIYVKAGGTATYEFTIRNLGNLADSYVMVAETTHKWSVSLAPSALSLDPGKSAVVKARLTVPAAASKGTEDLWLNITSDQNKSLSRSAIVSTNIMVEDIIAGLQIMTPLEKTGIPGNKVDIVFTIRNLGTITDDFLITARTDHAWSVELVGVGLDGLVKDVPTNMTSDVTVRVTVPINTVGPLQENVILNASSEYDPTKTATAQGKILVGRLTTKVISPANQTARPESVVRYEFEVRNTGDFRSTFLVSAVSSNGWQVGLVLSELTIDAGGSAKVTLNITVPKGTKSGTKDILTFTVRAKVDPNIEVECKVTTTVKAKGSANSTFSLLPIVLVIVVAAIAGGIGAALYSRRKKGKIEGTVEGKPEDEPKATAPQDGMEEGEKKP